MISREDFAKLKHGDIVRWQCKPTSIVRFRTVLIGEADRRKPDIMRASVKFAILRPSWTGRACTGYIWNDIKHIISTTGRRQSRLLNGDEIEALIKQGHNPAKQLLREWREAMNRYSVSPLKCDERLTKFLATGLSELRTLHLPL